ncbi:MAG TPA: hypothetical protein VGP47_11010, partial [Parachlamydiaceae bacterium]|nr:hypothetical protein [Parachlamydiaceae bacterium]
MNLTKFDLNSSAEPSNFSLTPSESSGLIKAEGSPLMLKKLGKKIQDNTQLTASKDIDPSRVEKFQNLNSELHSLYSKMTDLMQKSYNDESSSISREIEELESKVNDLESQFGKSISGKELNQLLDITKDFHNILKSAESYLAFKERFLVVDEQLSGSLELMSDSLYSDLHGWSPS